MADVFTKAKRSEVMSRIRGRGNERTELAMVRLLRANKITCWRRHAKLPGRPDFVFRAKRVAVFVDGCFWHGCPRCFRLPENNRMFWSRKIAANRERDKTVSAELRRAGWCVLRIWEHSLRASTTTAMSRLLVALGKAPLIVGGKKSCR